MTRLLWRLANAPLFVLIVAIGVAIQSSLFNSYPLLYLQPDVVLIAVIWCALRRGFDEGGILTLIFAAVAESHSSAPQGLFMIAYMAVYLGARIANKVLVIPSLSTMVMMTMAASIGWKFVYMLVLTLMGHSSGQWRHMLWLLFPSAAMAGATAIWVLRWLERFDWNTYKDPRARQGPEDEVPLDTVEGF